MHTASASNAASNASSNAASNARHNRHNHRHNSHCSRRRSTPRLDQQLGRLNKPRSCRTDRLHQRLGRLIKPRSRTAYALQSEQLLGGANPPVAAGSNTTRHPGGRRNRTRSRSRNRSRSPSSKPTSLWGRAKQFVSNNPWTAAAIGVGATLATGAALHHTGLVDVPALALWNTSSTLLETDQRALRRAELETNDGGSAESRHALGLPPNQSMIDGHEQIKADLLKKFGSMPDDSTDLEYHAIYDKLNEASRNALHTKHFTNKGWQPIPQKDAYLPIPSTIPSTISNASNGVEADGSAMSSS